MQSLLTTSVVTTKITKNLILILMQHLLDHQHTEVLLASIHILLRIVNYLLAIFQFSVGEGPMELCTTALKAQPVSRHELGSPLPWSLSRWMARAGLDGTCCMFELRKEICEPQIHWDEAKDLRVWETRQVQLDCWRGAIHNTFILIPRQKSSWNT